MGFGETEELGLNLRRGRSGFWGSTYGDIYIYTKVCRRPCCVISAQ